MLIEYIEEALRRATYELIDDIEIIKYLGGSDEICNAELRI
jgi:hypothetical protein